MECLYDIKGNKNVVVQDIKERIKYYSDWSEEISKSLADNGYSKELLEEAIELRKYLVEEYKNNNKSETKRNNKENLYSFNIFDSAITDMTVKTTGRLTRNNLNSFLYDIYDYGVYYLSQLE